MSTIPPIVEARPSDEQLRRRWDDEHGGSAPIPPHCSREISDGIAHGLKKVLSDDEVLKLFWSRGFKELTLHSSNTASQWIGKRIATMIVVALFSACLVYLVKNGFVK